MRSRTYQVKEVAAMSGLSVRALHHYDAIGLLKPNSRTAAGYRLYSTHDLLRLQQIVIGRELGLPLEEIRRMLDDPGFDRRKALLAQRAELERRAGRSAEMIRAVNAAIAIIDREQDAAIVASVCDAPRGGAASRMHEELDEEGTMVDFKAIFDGFDPNDYADEARQRWGSSEAYQVSMQRTKRYGDAEWRTIKAEQDAIYADAAAAMSSGKAPTDLEAMDVAERHRLSIERWFYPCSVQMHLGLAQMYEADPRFQKSIDSHAAGLTAFLSAAIRANAARQPAS